MINHVPYTRIGQIRPGEIVAAPWVTPIGDGALVKLTMDSDGIASGRFIDTSGARVRLTGLDAAPADHSTTTVQVTQVLGVDALFVVGMLVPDCGLALDRDNHGVVGLLCLFAWDSWASASIDGTVRQHGPRRLWDEVESAYSWWVEVGSPVIDRFGLSVEESGQQIWLDRPDNVLTHM